MSCQAAEINNFSHACYQALSFFRRESLGMRLGLNITAVGKYRLAQGNKLTGHQTWVSLFMMLNPRIACSNINTYMHAFTCVVYVWMVKISMHYYIVHSKAFLTSSFDTLCKLHPSRSVSIKTMQEWGSLIRVFSSLQPVLHLVVVRGNDVPYSPSGGWGITTCGRACREVFHK